MKGREWFEHYFAQAHEKHFSSPQLQNPTDCPGLAEQWWHHSRDFFKIQAIIVCWRRGWHRIPVKQSLSAEVKPHLWKGCLFVLFWGFVFLHLPDPCPYKYAAAAAPRVVVWENKAQSSCLEGLGLDLGDKPSSRSRHIQDVSVWFKQPQPTVVTSRFESGKILTFTGGGGSWSAGITEGLMSWENKAVTERWVMGREKRADHLERRLGLGNFCTHILCLKDKE